MAPSHLHPRQFGGPGDLDRHDRGLSTWAIISILVAVGIIALIVALLIFKRLRRRKTSRTANTGLPLHSTKPSKTTSPPGVPTPARPNAYGGSGGYGSTPDQNQSLLHNAEGPAIVTWDADQGVGSTQDGFGYNNGHLASGIQRPASVASFSAPPPRYEEVAAAGSLVPGQGMHGRRSSEGGLRPLVLSQQQGRGEAASYFNTGVSMGEGERGRSATREEGAARRVLSAETRGDGDRRRSISRFREEGMADLEIRKS